jgi:hypothetical protein
VNGRLRRGSGALDRPRDVDRLLRDFGTTVPRIHNPVAAPAERVFDRAAAPRGPRRTGHGWAPTLPHLAGYEMTSEQTPVLWPLIAGDGLPPTGAQMGIDVLTGGCFYCDPMGWVLDDEIPVTNPNIFIFGKPGRGKSGTVKIFLLRMMQFGYRALVLGDLKDEYEGLCRALGVEPFRIGRGLDGRINPLDPGPLGAGWEQLGPDETRRRSELIFSRWLSLVRGLVGSQKIGPAAVPFGPSDETAVVEALHDLTGAARGASRLRPVTLPQLWQALDEPSTPMLRACRYDNATDFYEGTRLLRDALGALCKGSLRGLFDGPSTFTPDWRAPIQSLSLASLAGSGDEGVGVALMCLNSWGQGMREVARPGDMRIVLRDEAWRQTRLGVEAVKALDANLRLSRADGDIQVVTYHKPSDPLTAGDDGSQAARIAKDLLHLADIRVLMGQDPAVAGELRSLLGLGASAEQVVTGWSMQAKGRALWLVGDRMFKVQTRMTVLEQQLTYTNDALTA